MHYGKFLRSCLVVIAGLSVEISLNAMGVDLDEQLESAVDHDNAKEVTRLLAEGANALAIDASNGTFLHRAAVCGSAQCMDIFIKAGVKVDAVNISGNTAAYLAAAFGHAKCLKKLVDAKAMVNYYNSVTFRTALYAAADKGHADCMKILLDADADPFLCEQWGSNAVDKVFGRGDEACIQALMDHYFDRQLEVPIEIAERFLDFKLHKKNLIQKTEKMESKEELVD
ncbi:MAG: ankyrin repeat domain-containing protein [Candidatus Babeliales bacterium]